MRNRFLRAWVLCSGAILLVLAGWAGVAKGFNLSIKHSKSGPITLQWDSKPGHQYVIQWTSNLNSTAVAWMTLDQIPSAGLLSSYEDRGSGDRGFSLMSQQGFYRIQELPATNQNAQPTLVVQDIAEATRWTLAGSPYLVTKDIRVVPGAALIIEAGVEVQFRNETRLIVDGILRANGEEFLPVLFTSASFVPWAGDWRGIEFSNISEDEECVLSHAIIEYARTGALCQGSSPILRDCVIQFCSTDGIFLEQSRASIQGCEIARNGANGINLRDQSSPSINGNRIFGNSQDGIMVSGETSRDRNSAPRIVGNQIHGNRSYGLRCQSFFRPAEAVIYARSNWWGSAQADQVLEATYDFGDTANSPVIDMGNWLDAPTGRGVPGIFVAGTITNNSSWNASATPIKATAHIIVPSNIVMRLEPGVSLEFLGNFRLEVGGGLEAVGTTAQPVLFTSGQTAQKPGDWEGIRFVRASGSCLVSNAVVEYARRGIFCQESAPPIVDSRVQMNSQEGISLDQSSPAILRNQIGNNGTAGIYCANSSHPRLEENDLWGNGSYGIQLQGEIARNRNSLPSIRGNRIFENRSYALYSSQYYQATNVVIQARHNWWGTDVPSAIAARIYDNNDTASAPLVDYGNFYSTFSGSPVGGTFVIGSVVSNASWRLADTPIRVLSHLTVASNVVVEIEPGVTVEFLGPYRLDVYGALNALGSAGRPIRFTSGNAVPWPGDWQGIHFRKGSLESSCLLSNAVVEYAEQGVSCYDSSPRIVNCTIHQNSRNGIYLERSSPFIQDNLVERNQQNGISARESSSPQIFGNRIVANQQAGIELTGNTSSNRNCLPLLAMNQIAGNRSYGLNARSYFKPKETVIMALSNWWGSSLAKEIADDVYDFNDNNGSPWVNYGHWLQTSNSLPTPGQAVFGSISSNAVWRASNNPLLMIGAVTIETNGSLSIEAGTRIEVMGNYRLEIAGQMQGLGRAGQPVTFTSGQPNQQPGDWLGLRFLDSSVDSSCALSNVVVQFAQNGIVCNAASPVLNECAVRLSSQAGISLENSSPRIRLSLIESNAGDGIYCSRTSSPLIDSSLIRSNTGSGISLAGQTASDQNSLPIITGCQILGNRSYNLNARSYFNSSQIVVNAQSNWWGSTEAGLIAASIYDRADSSSSPLVDYGHWLLSPTGPALSGTFIFTSITNHTQWSMPDSPYRIIADIGVSPNTVLSIDPGVMIEFMDNYRLEVSGTLRALGDLTNKVIFTSGKLEPRPNNWLGIRFNDSSSDTACILSNVVVEYAKRGIECSNASPQLLRSQMRRNETGIYLENSSPLLADNLVEYNDTGITCFLASSPQVRSNTITLNRFHGMELRGNNTQGRNPNPAISGNSIFGNGTAGINYYGLATASYYQAASIIIDATGNWWGNTDSNLIEKAIYHRNDSTSLPRVDFSLATATNIIFSVYGLRSPAFWISPNQDGTNDQLTIQATLSQPGNWRAVILDSGMDPVRSYTGNGTVVDVAWDGNTDSGQPVPEGRYRVRVEGESSSRTSAAVSAGDPTYVDRTFPQIGLTATALPDGTLANTVTFTGTAADSLLNYHALEFGSGSNPSNYRTIVSNTAPALQAVLARWDTRALTNGLYTLRYLAVDRAGNLVSTQWMARVDNVLFSHLSISNQFFDPLSQATTLSFELNKPSEVDLKIVRVLSSANFMGELDVTLDTNVIYRATRSFEAGRHALPWNGRDEFGTLRTNGVFAFTLEARAALGRLALYQPEYVPGPVTVSNTVVSAQSNFQANEPMSISYWLYTPAYIFVAVPNANYPVIWGEPRDAGHYTDYWNGRNSADRTLIYGRFSMAIKTQIMPENSIVIRYKKDRIVADLQTESYIITPSLSGVSEVQYRLNMAAEVDLRVRCPNGDMILLQPKSLKPAGFHAVEWNGFYDDSRIVHEEGDYEVYLRAADPATGILEQKTANLTVRR